MANAAGLIRRMDSALRRFAPLAPREVYKRVVTRTGGDALTGRGQTASTVDTLLDPQPLYQRLGRNVVGNNAAAEKFLSHTADQTEVADDYAMTLSPTAVSLAELEDPNFTFVFKTAAGAEEVFRITDFEPVGLKAENVMFLVYIRSTARP